MGTVASGYQEEVYEEMPEIAIRDPHKKISAPMESIYSLTARERRMSEGRSLSLEDICMREERGMGGEGDSVRPKEHREKKVQVHSQNTRN